MNREKLKASGRPRGGGGPRAAAQGTKVSAALGPGKRTVTLRGTEYEVRPIDLNDLVEIEEAFGDIADFMAQVQGMRARALRYLFWLSLRRGISPEPTLEEIGAILPVRNDQIVSLLTQILEASGLVEQGAESPGETQGSSIGPE